jgi:DNA-binding GntR family transcriptional regulator
MGRTPIREAFRQLETEGFLTTVPRKGTVVAPITVQDVRDFYEIKSLLEGYAARRACERITAGELAEMEECNERLLEAHRENDLTQMLAFHNRFHEIFVRAAGNERLAQMVDNLVMQGQRFRILLSLSDVMADLVDQHRAIVSALSAHDPDRAEALVRENARHGEEALIGRLEAQDDALEVAEAHPERESR